MFSDAPDDKLRVLDDRVTILHITAVFRLFPFEKQKRVADRCLRLLRKDTGKPVVILGSQGGKREGGMIQRGFPGQELKDMFRHNVETWRRMWEEVVQTNEWNDKVKIVDVQSAVFKRGISIAEDGVFFSPLDSSHTQSI